MSEEIKQAFDVLKNAVNNDPDYAWSWHCNIAMAFVDEGGSHEAANKAAARIMSILFEHDITKHPHYQYRDISPEQEAKLMESYKELHGEIIDQVVTESNLLPPTDQDHGDIEHHPI